MVQTNHTFPLCRVAGSMAPRWRTDRPESRRSIWLLWEMGAGTYVSEEPVNKWIYTVAFCRCNGIESPLMSRKGVSTNVVVLLFNVKCTGAPLSDLRCHYASQYLLHIIQHCLKFQPCLTKTLLIAMMLNRSNVVFSQTTSLKLKLYYNFGFSTKNKSGVRADFCFNSRRVHDNMTWTLAIRN